MDRRQFIITTSMVGIGLTTSNANSESKKTNDREFAVFSKSLEKLPYNDLADVISDLGIAGIEAPLRKGGHIEPSEIIEKLPSFVKALSEKQLRVLIMTSSINHVDKKGVTEKQLRAAAEAGIKKYRLAYLKYDLKKPLKPQLKNFTAQLKDLAELNKELGIQGVYQNHRGKNLVGAPILDMVGMLEEINMPELGLAFDFAHATVEGSNAWHMNFLRALPHIGAIYFKDYKVSGKQWLACPLGEGMVAPLAGKLVTKMLPKDIPISLHVEYMKNKTHKDFLGALKTDLQTLRSWL